MTIFCCNEKYTTIISKFTQKTIENGFYKFGLYAYFNPIKLIILATIFSLSWGFAIFLLEFEFRFFYMVVPRTSQVWDQNEFAINNFGESPSNLQLILYNKEISILTPNIMNTSYNIFNSINYIDTVYDDKMYKYNDLCVPGSIDDGTDCLSTETSLFGIYFNNTPSNWINESDILNAVNTLNSIYPINYFLGVNDIQYSNKDGSPYIEKAYSLLINYEGILYSVFNIWCLIHIFFMYIYIVVRSDLDSDINYFDISYEFMKDWNEYWSNNANNYDNIDEIYYMSTRSLDDEISQVLLGDLGIFVVAFTLILSYLIFILSSCKNDGRCITTRIWLPLSVGIIILLCMCISLGIGSLMGITAGLIVGLVPYIILGVGIDDIIIIYDSFQRQKMRDKNTDNNVAIILAKSLKHSGLSITLTSFCSFIAFFIASLSTSIRGNQIQAFCSYASWSFLSLYLIQFFIFLPLMVIDESRYQSRRNFCCFCYKHKHIELKTKLSDDLNSKDSNESSFGIRMILTNTIVFILKHRTSRIIIILIYFGILIASGFTVSQISTDVEFNLMVQDDSYVIDFRDKLSESFGDQGILQTQYIVKMTDFSDEISRNNILSSFDVIRTQSDTVSLVNWLEPFIEWSVNVYNNSVNDMNSDQFYEYLNIFMADPDHKAWTKEIKLNVDGNIIDATRFYLNLLYLEDEYDKYDQYTLYNNIIKDNNIDGYMFNQEYGLSYFSTIITRLTIENMIFAGIGVFCVLLLFMDFRIACFILMVVAMIDVDLFAWMYIFNISLQPVTYVILVMSIGLTVDYVIHITFAIVDASHETDYYKRIKYSISTMGVSVLKGAFTTLLGGFPLSFSKSTGFKIFYLMYVGVIFISILHGMILTPALLGEFQCLLSTKNHSNKTNNKPNYNDTTMSSIAKQTSESNIETQMSSDINIIKSETQYGSMSH